jgi:hypothetical protein
MHCPFGATCDTNETSVYVCNHSADGRTPEYCYGYGIVPDSGYFNATAQLIDEHDWERGFSINFTSQSSGGVTRRTELTLRCNHDFVRGHIGVDPLRSYVDNSSTTEHILHIDGFSRDSCPGMNPSPIPNVTMCHVRQDQSGYTLELNLMHYQKSDPYNVSVHDAGFEPRHYDLLYSPCGNSHCPSGCDCLGDTEAAVWLCDKPDPEGQMPICERYGHHNENHTLLFNTIPGHIFSGLHALYGDNDDTWGNVDWECNRSLGDGELIFGHTIDLDGETDVLRFTVYSKEACPTGSGPTPSPPVYIAVPSPGPTPTMHPRRSPYPYHVFKTSDKYIMFDFEQIQELEPLYRHNVPVNVSLSNVTSDFTTVSYAWSSWHSL